MPDTNEILKQAKQALDEAVLEKRRNRDFIKSVGPAIVESLKPILGQIALQAKSSQDSLIRAISSLQVQISPEIKIPDIIIPDVKIPQIKVPESKVSVSIPEIKLPQINVPSLVLPENLSVNLKGVNELRPLPVLVINPTGGPRGGLTLSDIVTPSGVSIIDSPNTALRVNVVTGLSNTQYNDGATPDQSGGVGTVSMLFDGSSARSFRGSSYGIPTVQLSGFDGSLIGITSNALDSNVKSWGSSVDTNIGPSGANTLRITMATDAISSVNIVTGGGGTQYNDSATPDVSGGVLTLAGAYDGTGSVFSLRNGPGVSDKALRVTVATDSNASVSLTSITGPIGQGDTASALRVVHAGDSQASVVVNGFNNGAAVDVGIGPSGTQTLRVTMATDANSSVNLVAQDQNSGPVSASTLRVVQAVDVGLSTQLNAFGSSVDTNNGPAGANTLRVVQAVDVATSVNLVQLNGSAIAGGSGEAGSNSLRVVQATDIIASVQGQSIARTSLPTAGTNGNPVFNTADKFGRQLVVPITIRDLVATAYATLNSNAETNIIVGVASTFLDVIMLTASNTSANAVNIDIRDGTGGAIIHTIAAPAGAESGWAPVTPWPQTEAAQTWTCKFNAADISNTTIYLGGLFAKNQ